MIKHLSSSLTQILKRLNLGTWSNNAYLGIRRKDCLSLSAPNFYFYSKQVGTYLLSTYLPNT